MCEITFPQLKGNEFGDLTSTSQLDEAKCGEKCNEESFIEDLPGVDLEKVTAYPNWCDASYRDLYEVVISNLPMEITKEMILQCIPSAEEKYTLVITNNHGRKNAVLRFGPFYSLGLKTYVSAKKVFNENAQFLKIRTHPPSIKIVGIPAEITKSQMQEVFPKASYIQIQNTTGKRIAILEHDTFESSRRVYNILKSGSLPCNWIKDCFVAQNPERVEEIRLSDSEFFST